MRGAKIVTFVPLNKLFLKPNQISWIRQRENNNVKIGFGEGTILAVELSCFLATKCKRMQIIFERRKSDVLHGLVRRWLVSIGTKKTVRKLFLNFLFMQRCLS